VQDPAIGEPAQGEHVVFVRDGHQLLAGVVSEIRATLYANGLQ
jgi:hypothetical protein